MKNRVTGFFIKIQQVSRMRYAVNGPSHSETTRSFTKRVDAIIEGFPDRGSTPLASTFCLRQKVPFEARKSEVGPHDHHFYP